MLNSDKYTVLPDVCHVRLLVLLVVMIFTANAELVCQQPPLQFPFGDRPVPRRANIQLPPARGATVLSTQLHASAANMLAAGSYLESVAMANYVNAHARIANIQASRDELRYHVDRVSTYFDLRRMNQAWQREKNPYLHERADKADTLMDSLIKDQPEYIIKQLDITGRLNWMFERLANRLYSDELVNSTEIFGGSKFTQNLSTIQIKQIVLESTERINGERIRTPLVDTNAGHQKLPPVFTHPKLREASANYLGCRQRIIDCFLDEDSNTPSHEHWQLVYGSLDRLQADLAKAITPEERSFPNAFHDYYSGKRFIKSQGAAMYFVHRTGKGEHLIGSDVFDGNSFGELLNFMVQRGFQFGRPEQGGRSAYESLFRMMRTAYMAQ